MTPTELKQARQLLGLSQRELGESLGWSGAKQISNLETGARTITEQTALAVECLLRRAGKERVFLLTWQAHRALTGTENLRMNGMMTVRELLAEAGMAPRFGWDGFNAAVLLADAVASTIQEPIKMALFVAESAAELKRLDYHPFDTEGLAKEIRELAEWANDQRPTPSGSVELWGAMLQWVPDPE